MMKFLLLLISTLLLNACLILDKAGLNLNETSIKGSEAKDLILAKALAGAAVGGVSTDIALPFVANRLANIKDEKYYRKKDVESCAFQAMLINYITINVGGFNCQLREHKDIIDWPVPLL